VLFLPLVIKKILKNHIALKVSFLVAILEERMKAAKQSTQPPASYARGADVKGGPEISLEGPEFS